MKRTCLLFVFIMLAMVSFAGKTYTLTLTVLDEVTLKRLPMASVSLFSNKGKVFEGKTDVLGKIIINEVSGKLVLLRVETQENIYEPAEIEIKNSKMENISESISMKYTYDEQVRFNDVFDERYNDSEEKYFDEKKDSVTSDFQIAAFPGGRAELMKFLATNMKYPENCIKQGIEGKVYLTFFIQKDGRVTNVKAFKRVHTSLDLEAIRTVRTSPLWQPAMLDGKPIKSVFYLPVNFRLN